MCVTYKYIYIYINIYIYIQSAPKQLVQENENMRKMLAGAQDQNQATQQVFGGVGRFECATYA